MTEVHKNSTSSAWARVLVVAGGTGAGKTMVCAWLAERGAFVIDADRIGHEILLDPSIRTQLEAKFGADVLDEAGQIDRRELGRRVFADAAQLTALEAIVHPPLVAELRRRVETLGRSRAAELVVIDAALWTRFPDPPKVDFVLAMTAPEPTRIARIVARDGIDEGTARGRIDRQQGIEASLADADAVLDSACEPDALRANLWALLDERLGLRLASTQMPPTSF